MLTDMTWTRRDFLRAGATAGAIAAAPGLVGCAPAPAGPPANPAFPQGVASGDPHADSVVLWTRLAGTTVAPRELRWQIATDPEMTDVVANGTVATSVDADGTAKVVAGGLEPATTYYYRWLDGETSSPVGRTRTAPSGGADHLRFAVASCSNLGYGWFHNYRAIAGRSDLDAVIHLGDYIYEYAQEGSGETYGTARPLDPPHEIVTLGDYRRRYACYRDDPDLQELHRQHPVIHVWDVHEFADDPFVGGAANHQPAQDGPWADRVAAALRAYGEWMPTRLDGNRIHRVLDYGALARIVVVDRQRRFLWPEDDDADWYLGREQFDWLDERLAENSATWLVLAQQTTFGATGDDLVSGGWGPAQRGRVYRSLDRAVAGDLVVLTGDIHRAHAIDLVDGSGAEFSCGSITSPGGDSTDGGPQVRWTMGSSRTYLVLDMTPDRVQADWFGFPDLLKYLPFRPDEQHLGAFAAHVGGTRLEQRYVPAG